LHPGAGYALLQHGFHQLACMVGPLQHDKTTPEQQQ
jgi:hypothetical protein